MGKKKVVLFEDKWCKVTEDAFYLKWFYFPTTQDKKIKVTDIKAVYYQDQSKKMSFGTMKGWGMSLTPCWWACDIQRQLRNGVESKGKDEYYHVVIDTGDTTYKGFTTKSIGKLLRVAQNILPPGVLYMDQLPF